jgi:hypothetical protein
MNREFSLIPILAVLLLGSSCVRLSKNNVPSATLCELQANPSLGKSGVVVDALYDSDSSTFSDLVDKRCKGSSQRMRVGEEANDADSSVRRFFNQRRKACTASGILALCSIRADVRAEIIVERDEHGLALASFRRILSYRFIEN